MEKTASTRPKKYFREEGRLSSRDRSEKGTRVHLHPSIYFPGRLTLLHWTWNQVPSFVREYENGKEHLM